jgi:Amidohydrolase
VSLRHRVRRCSGALVGGLLLAWTPALLLAWTPALAQPVVDTHVHYNRESWRAYPPEDALALMDAAGIRWALVSSTPDDGTLALYELAPQRVVPMLRPYRMPSDFATWTSDPSVLAEIEARLQTNVAYRGIGEFELEPGQAYDPVPRRLADVAAERGLWLHAHAEPLALGELAALRPDVRVLWAHAGVTASPEAVSATLAEHSNVWVEFSLRSSEIAPDGALDPAWAALFVQYAARVMLGSDTWVPAQWTALPRLHADNRAWLAQLPVDVAFSIASGNASQLFGEP